MFKKIKTTLYSTILLGLTFGFLTSQAIAKNINTSADCKTAAKAKGLKLGGKGYAFSGGYGTKGCYAYKGGKYNGRAYFGTGGSKAQMAAKLRAPKYRISLASGNKVEANGIKICKAAAKAKGLKLGGKGYAFSGGYATKGCYAYKGGKYNGRAYFGTGGSKAQMAAKLRAPKYRISLASGNKSSVSKEKQKKEKSNGIKICKADVKATYAQWNKECRALDAKKHCQRNMDPTFCCSWGDTIKNELQAFDINRCEKGAKHNNIIRERVVSPWNKGKSPLWRISRMKGFGRH